MRRLAVLLLSAVAFAGFSTGAEAASKRLVTKAKPVTKAPPPSSSGTGFYVGINGGYDWGRATFTDITGAASTIRVPSGMIGPTLGYNAQNGTLVYGIETDFDWTWLKNTNFNAPPCFGCEARLRYFGTLRGRLGSAVGQSLPYITGGLAYGRLQLSQVGGLTSQSDTKAGWTVGVGVEHAVGGAWSVKLEYLYFELGRVGCSPGNCGDPVNVRLLGNMVRVGTNFRF